MVRATAYTAQPYWISKFLLTITMATEDDKSHHALPERVRGTSTFGWGLNSCIAE